LGHADQEIAVGRLAWGKKLARLHLNHEKQDVVVHTCHACTVQAGHKCKTVFKKVFGFFNFIIIIFFLVHQFCSYLPIFLSSTLFGFAPLFLL
jgi:hypothetical protein